MLSAPRLGGGCTMAISQRFAWLGDVQTLRDPARQSDAFPSHRQNYQRLCLDICRSGELTWTCNPVCTCTHVQRPLRCIILEQPSVGICVSSIVWVDIVWVYLAIVYCNLSCISLVLYLCCIVLDQTGRDCNVMCNLLWLSSTCSSLSCTGVSCTVVCYVWVRVRVCWCGTESNML